MKKKIISLLLAVVMIVGILPSATFAEDLETDVGKHAQFNGDYGDENSFFVLEAEPVSTADMMEYHIYEFSEDLLFEITNAKVLEESYDITDQQTGEVIGQKIVQSLWYQVSVLAGTVPEDFLDGYWILQNYLTEADAYEQNVLILSDPQDQDLCGICGKPGCTQDHTLCPVCGTHCGKTHLYCRACGEADCEKTHVWCDVCGAYDCGIEHTDTAPDTAPVIPENPTMTQGADVSVTDAYGDPVTAEGFTLTVGMKSSLSAWTALTGGSYQWQICYDDANDRWADILGQTGKGMLISPAMILSIAGENGAAKIRCVVTSGDATLTSAAIPVRIAQPLETSAFTLNAGIPESLAEGDGTDLEKNYVVVQYLYADGRTAATSEFAELIPGAAYTHSYTLPVIPGYKATLNTHSFDTSAQIVDGALVMNFAENVLTEKYTIFTVTYEPDFVSYTVIHYWQNVDNDNYTEHERETITVTHKTGDVITDAHKSYPGFYNLLYETPAAAADGSTVIEVYYDRYYYLMKFELDGGYGVDPIYARYGAPVEIGTPTRAGYGFGGWTDADGNAVTIPETVPVNGGTYHAKWTPVDTEYTVAYWIQNEDGTRTYIGSKIVGAESGTTVSGSDDLTIETNTCGMPEHTHDSCTKTCPLDEHTHGDGYCIYNCGETFHDHTSGCVYDCGQESHATHIRTCYDFSSADVSYTNTTVTSNDVYTTKDGFDIYRQRNGNYQWRYYVRIGSNYYQITDYNNYYTSLAYTLTCHVHSNDCCAVEYHDHSNCECIIVPHIHTVNCYSCGINAHTHSDACKSDLAKYVDFVKADQNVTVKGDGSTVVDVYYEYRTYTIRFIYAKKNGNSYQIAGLTRDGTLDNCWWTNGGNSLPTFIDPSGKTERSTVVIDGATYYYISLTAKFGEEISDIWPSANIGNAGGYEWGSWAAAQGTGYRIKYGDEHANIVGPYPTMSADMIVANPEKLADGTYLAQNMIAWWGSNQGIEAHAYHNYFELLPGEDTTGAVLYNGKYYKLVETYTFTAAHNGDTRVDPIYFNGFKCINDTRDTNKDLQENSENFPSGNCEICKANGCNYHNNFYYDRNMHKLYFWNYNGPLMEGTGSDVMYGTSLVSHGTYVNDAFMEKPENYPEGLEPGAFKFSGWYTTADCHEGTEMDWNTTMPDADMTVYAKWVPVTHTVQYFLTADSMTRGEDIPTEMARLVKEAVQDGVINAAPATDPYTTAFADDYILHGEFIEGLSKPGVTAGYEKIHPRAGYDFIGWFYLNEKGEETAFDPENMPVHQDLDLYGKWSSDVLCKYNVYFALDNNGDGIADTQDGQIVYVADPISGSAIAGRTYTFAAKGGEDLYDGYREGYFPTVGSHSIVIDITDLEGTDANSFTFLYKPKAAVPYTVKYIDKDTGENLFDDKVVDDNRNVVVTENFRYKQGYMPDAYQKTLVVTDDNNETNDVIIFYYTKDNTHALYMVNYYIQQLDADLNHTGWIKYTDLQQTGDIGSSYTADAITIDGFTLSGEYTDDYNVEKKINGAEGTLLPTDDVSRLADGKLSGKLTDKGMELNFYYTRNLYPYEFRYMLNGTTTELAEPKYGKAGYDAIVTEAYKEIVMDLDGDGVNEDYRLYDPTETTKDIHIKKDGEPLDADATVTKGQATVNVATFYYVRCTQTMTVTKKVVDNSAELDPDPNRSFDFSLLIHATGYHKNSYAYTKTDGTVGTLTPEITAPNILRFTLKAGETITIEGLPTAEYTVSELNLPTGYYDVSGTNVKNKLTVDAQVDITVVNSFEPANLTITKTVDVVEEDTNTPEIQEFVFTVTVPSGVTGSYDYSVGGTTRTATVSGGKITVMLKNGETATFLNLPTGAYAVTETDYSAYGYDSNYSVNGAAFTEGQTANVTLVRDTTQAVRFENEFPVGDLVIEKTVNKEFYGTDWSGDTFTFTVERTTAGRPLIAGNQYKVLLDGVEQSAKADVVDGKLTLTLSFSEADAAKLTAADGSVKHTLTIKNLPAGTYTVEENTDADYVQTPEGLTVSNLTIPAESTTASFTNTVKRKYGNLYLEKELEVLTGYMPPMEEIKFSFTLELLEEIPAQDQTFQVVYSPDAYSDGTATATAVTMSGGKLTLTLEANQNVTVTGLPEGKYRITEATVPYYANAFAYKVEDQWVPQTSTTTEEGQMYTEFDVEPEGIARIKCTNTYPVDRAELIIQKLVTKEYARDTLPDGEYTFTVTLAEADMDSYTYKVYGKNGGFVREATAAADGKKVFTIKLEADQYAVIPGMPVCGYTVAETVDTTDYNVSYSVYVSKTGDVPSTTVTTGTASDSGTGTSVSRTFAAGNTDAVVFTNRYKRHLGTLTISKKVTDTGAKDTFVFHVWGTSASNSHIDLDVVVKGGEKVTIYDLPLGTYNVTEDTAWSWRYEAVGNSLVSPVITLDALYPSVEFTNRYTENQWLTYDVTKANIFGKKEDNQEGS